MTDIPWQRYAGAVAAFGVYRAPSLTGWRLSRPAAILLGLLALLIGLALLGAIDLGPAAGLAAGPVITDRSKELRQKAGASYKEARDLLAASEDGSLDAEGQKRYDELMDEGDRLLSSARAHERSVRTDASTSEPLTDPTVPDTRTGDDGGPADTTPTELRDLPPELRTAILEAPADIRTKLVARASESYRISFRKFLRGGMSAIAGTPEARALQADIDASGGYLVLPLQVAQRIVKALDDATPIRGLSPTFLVPNAEGLGVPTLTADPDDADWTSELATGNEDSAMAFGRRELKPNPLAKRIKVSRKLIRQAFLDIESYVVERVSFKHAVAQDKAFNTGSGAGRPLGVFTASADGISTGRDTTAANASSIVADDLINVKHDLKPQYWRNARWVFHRLILKEIRKLKDANNQYIWVPGLQAGVADEILDVPYVLDEFAPSTITTGLYTALIGDFNFYWIVDALSMDLQRLDELYAEANQVGFIGRVETDGMPILEEAFRRLKQA